jgi:hypothetical protein
MYIVKVRVRVAPNLANIEGKKKEIMFQEARVLVTIIILAATMMES